MSAADETARARTRPGRDCPAAGNVTRSRLGYLALAGPFYVVVSLAPLSPGEPAHLPASKPKRPS